MGNKELRVILSSQLEKRWKKAVIKLRGGDFFVAAPEDTDAKPVGGLIDTTGVAGLILNGNGEEYMINVNDLPREITEFLATFVRWIPTKQNKN